MHKKFSKEGFAAVSVSLDDPKDKPVMQRVQKFLEAQGATFTNLVLDEPPEVWQEKLRFDGPPSIFVFDRQGLWKQFTGDEADYAKIEQLAVELLKRK
jgi:hypothetical protein